jgi:hypothetical protein
MASFVLSWCLQVEIPEIDLHVVYIYIPPEPPSAHFLKRYLTEISGFSLTSHSPFFLRRKQRF